MHIYIYIYMYVCIRKTRCSKRRVGTHVDTTAKLKAGNGQDQGVMPRRSNGETAKGTKENGRIDGTCF